MVLEDNDDFLSRATAESYINNSRSRASLYVGDLHRNVTDEILFEKFSTIGPVSTVHVCRDAISRRSLGYGYVNFQERDDAETALETLNFAPLFNKPMRIMWSQPDTYSRRSNAANVFVNNLDKYVDSKTIYDVFSKFGKIFSCKVACYSNGSSKGHGFVQFELEESAQKAIDHVDGLSINGKAIVVSKFLPMESRFTNIYVANFADKLDKEKLEQLFSKFGEITSAVVMLDEEGNSKGFGFVSFKKPESAESAVYEMDGYMLEDKLELIVNKARKKKTTRKSPYLNTQY